MQCGTRVEQVRIRLKRARGSLLAGAARSNPEVGYFNRYL
jgi:hypothetical protein